MEKSQPISAPYRTNRQPSGNVPLPKPIEQEALLADRLGNQTAATAEAERARWLAQLAFAIERAQRLTRTLATSQRDEAEAIELDRRLEAARLEVEELRRNSRLLLRREIDPKWMGLLPWDRRRRD